MTNEVQEMIMSIIKTHEGNVRSWMDLGNGRCMYFASLLFCGSTIKALIDHGFVCLIDRSYYYEDLSYLEVVLTVFESDN